MQTSHYMRASRPRSRRRSRWLITATAAEAAIVVAGVILVAVLAPYHLTAQRTARATVAVQHAHATTAPMSEHQS